MQAFEGMRVLDLTHVLAGPFAAYQLAVLGADVIKIEGPDHPDMSREMGPVEALNRAMMGANFLAQNANKRAMTLNLKSAAGREIFMRLAAGADVIIENFRAGALDRLGLGWEHVRAVKPDIIYCSVTGFGHTGPKAGHGAFDNVIQACSGLMDQNGYNDGGPGVMVGPPLLDYGTGVQAAFAVAAALLRRERTGEGQRLDVAMLDAALMLMADKTLDAAAGARKPGRAPLAGVTYAGYGAYEASDTTVMIGACTPAQYARLWRALGRDDLAAEMKGLRIPDMTARADRDRDIITDIIKTRTADEWEAALTEAGLPAARVRTIEEALAGAQVQSRPVTADVTAPPGAATAAALNETFTAAVAAFACDADGARITSPPAEMGQHTDEILAELGCGPERIAELRAEGAV
ncbi:MAG: CaiB/BaiF CoA transferase family protein [Rhodospirillales bacterium]